MAEIMFTYNNAAKKLKTNQIKIKWCVGLYLIIEVIMIGLEIFQIYYLIDDK